MNENRNRKMLHVESLYTAILKLYQKLRDKTKTKWNRDLPIDELMFDRWERAKNLHFGEGASIYHNSYVYGDVQVGEGTWIGPFTILDGTGGLKIGRFCSISAGVQIYTHDTVQWALTGGRAKYEHQSVEIENHCYIGPQAVITKGVKIGAQSVIGAFSLVNKDIPRNTIFVGSPCRQTGIVEMDSSANPRLRFDIDKTR